MILKTIYLLICIELCLGDLLPANSSSSNLPDGEMAALLQQTIDGTVATLRNLETIYKKTADKLLKDHQEQIRQSVKQISTLPSSTTNVSVIIAQCLEDGNYDQILSDLIIEHLDSCAIVSLAEVVNIISNSINEAQTFLDLPTLIARDLENCGLAPECLPLIVYDSFYESLQTPSKVLVLAARVQQFAFKAVETVTGCALDAVASIGRLQASIAEEVIQCLSDKITC